MKTNGEGIPRGSPLTCRVASFFIVFLLGLAAFPARAQALPTNEELRAAIEEAGRLEREERWEEARDLYLELGRSYPTDRNILYGLDRVYRSIEDNGRYLEFLRESYRDHPRDVLLFRHYLNVSIRYGRTEEIGRDVRLFIESRKPTESVYRTLYSIFMQTNLNDMTESILLEGEEALGEPHLFSRELSDLYLQTARYGESLEEALNMLARDPESLPFVKKRMISLRGVLPDGEIIGKVEKYAARRERTAAFLSLQSWLYVRSGDMRGALSVLRKLSARNAEAGIKALADLAEACEARGSFLTGIEAYRLLAELDPPNEMRYDLKAAGLLRTAGDLKKARREYLSALESDPDPAVLAEIYLSLGEIALYDFHRTEEALDWLERAAVAAGGDERSAGARLSIAGILVFLGDLEGAEAECELASGLDLPPDLGTEVNYARGVVGILDGRTDEGRELLGRVARRGGHVRANDALEALAWLDRDASMDLAVARGLIERKFIARIERPDRSIQRLESLREPAGGTPLSLDVDYFRARMLREAGRYEHALEVLDRIAAVGDDHRLVPFALWEMADIFRRDIGDWGRARKLLELVVLEHGESVIAPRARRDLEEIEGEGGPNT